MELNLEQQLKHIRTLPIFDELQRNDLSIMLEKKIICIMSFEPNEIIITEKSFERKFFLTLKGSVTITKDVLVDDCKHCKELKKIEGPGHFLGEVTAFTGKPRTATVRANTQTVCVMVNMNLLINTSSILQEAVVGKFYPRLFELLCRRLDETNERLVASQQKNENLEQELKHSQAEKATLKKKYQSEIQDKIKTIVALQEQLEII